MHFKGISVESDKRPRKVRAYKHGGSHTPVIQALRKAEAGKPRAKGWGQESWKPV